MYFKENPYARTHPISTGIYTLNPKRKPVDELISPDRLCLLPELPARKADPEAAWQVYN